jgi:Transcriptional regulator
MNYNKLYYFYIVTQLGSMSRAAEKLFVSQPALSKAVKELEWFFEVELFYHGRRKLMLTPAGKALRKECIRMFADEDGMLQRIRQYRGADQETLNFGYMVYKEIFCLKSVFSGFQEQSERILLNAVSYIERTDLTNDLLSGKIDVGLKLFTMEDLLPELEFCIIEESHLAIVMDEHHPLAKLPELHLSELSGESFIFLGKDRNSSEYNTTKEWCRRCGFEPKITECYDHVGMVLMMVKAGFGITILSDLAPTDYINGLVTVPLVNAPVFYSGLFWKRDNLKSAAAQFVEYFLLHRKR